MGQPDFLARGHACRDLPCFVTCCLAPHCGGSGRAEGTITNDIAAAEDLKQKAVEAEEAYNKALADARAEANSIIADTKADIQKDLDVALAKADAEITAKTAEGEKAIAAIREGALESVKAVAKDTAKELVSAMGGTADAKSITAAVTARMKG